MTQNVDRMCKAALAWFIYNDETNHGGHWEASNAYWLNRRRAALTLFENGKEIADLAKEFDSVVSQKRVTILTEDEEKNF